MHVGILFIWSHIIEMSDHFNAKWAFSEKLQILKLSIITVHNITYCQPEQLLLIRVQISALHRLVLCKNYALYTAGVPAMSTCSVRTKYGNMGIWGMEYGSN